MSETSVVTRQEISDAVQKLDLTGHALMVHSSLRSFGRVDGGAGSVIGGLLDQGCTIMVPTFSRMYELRPPRDRGFERNGKEYEGGLELPAGASPAYAPESNLVNPSMGVIPSTLLAMPGRARGSHARQSFAAIGPRAEELVAGQTPSDVFAPVRNLARMAGSIVLMGVGLVRMSALHGAEEMAGRRPFRRWAYGPDGIRAPFAIGGCSGGFENLQPALSSVERRTVVGRSPWRVFPAAETLERASGAMRSEPSISRCDKEVCRDCEDAIAGGPLVSGAA